MSRHHVVGSVWFTLLLVAILLSALLEVLVVHLYVDSSRSTNLLETSLSSTLPLHAAHTLGNGMAKKWSNRPPTSPDRSSTTASAGTSLLDQVLQLGKQFEIEGEKSQEDTSNQALSLQPPPYVRDGPASAGIIEQVLQFGKQFEIEGESENNEGNNHHDTSNVDVLRITDEMQSGDDERAEQGAMDQQVPGASESDSKFKSLMDLREESDEGLSPTTSVKSKGGNSSESTVEDGLHQITPVSGFPSSDNRTAVWQVLLLPSMPLNERQAFAKHLLFDGINQSPRLRFTSDKSNFADNVVWVMDLLAARDISDDWCTDLYDKIVESQQEREEVGAPTTWPIALVDNRDNPIVSSCTEIGEAVGDSNVRYSFRSLVKDRLRPPDAPWIQLGHVLDPTTFSSRYHYQHRPIGVRTDTVASVAAFLQETYERKLCHSIEELDRPVDVSYFWEFTNYTRKDASLRDQVFEILRDMDRTTNWTMVVGLRGPGARQGRKKVSSAYVEAMLQSKIVVVAQRDEWEDHYRLFEAIVAGSLVFTDKMLSLPRGLKDGTSVVEYTSADDLRTKIAYYLRRPERRLQIAKAGRRVAMSRHRSWHHMEEIVFGAPVTVCTESTGSQCPFMVDADQADEAC